jgi:hypothetical protein
VDVQCGPGLVSPERRTLTMVRGLSVRNLRRPASSVQLPDVQLTVDAVSASDAGAGERVPPPSLAAARQSAVFVGERQPATLNPQWQFDASERRAQAEPVLCDAHTMHVFVWQRTDANADADAHGVLLLSQTVRLARLTFVGDSLLALGVQHDDSLLIELNDGIYMSPHHAIGLYRVSPPAPPAVPPPTVSFDAQTLLRLVNVSLSIDASLRNSAALARDAAVALVGGAAALPSADALEDVGALDVASASSAGERQRAYILLLAERQLMSARVAALRGRLQEQRAAVAMRRAKVEARRDALLQGTVRLSAQRSSVSEARVALVAEADALRGVRRAQHKAEARVRVLQWTLSARLLRVFIVTTSSDGATLCINALRLPNSDFNGADEESIAAALGSVCHCVSLLSRYLDVPLRYPVRPIGSRSLITDPISALSSAAPHFPLYARGVDRTRFEYAVFLLNKNIEQLLHSQQLEVITLRHTLPNVHRLMMAAKRSSAAAIESDEVPQDVKA